MMDRMFRSALAFLMLLLASACSTDPGETNTTSGTPPTTSGTGDSGTGTQGTGGGTVGPESTSTAGSTSSDPDGDTVELPKLDVLGIPDAGPGDCITCSSDLQQVLTCQGGVVAECGGNDGCDIESGTCIEACEAAANASGSLGCEFHATLLEQSDGDSRCFAAFVANTWDTPVHLDVQFAGMDLDVESFAYIPNGSGPGLTYDPYDNTAGLAPGEVVILVLSGPQGAGAAQCPVPSAMTNGAMVIGTGIGNSFRITADLPVVAYQINPYGGGSAAVTGASLLLPTSAWGDNYVIVNPLQQSAGVPTANIVAAEDDTTVTIEPFNALAGGGGIPATAAGATVDVVLGAGEQLQLSQSAELTGSIVLADKPVGLMAGHSCMFAPVDVLYCDHAEQMIPPVQSLGSEYVAVMHKPRMNEPSIWRVIGAVDDTQLTYSSNVGGPATVDRGDAIEFVTGDPFIVQSQDEEHPFVLANLMSGSTWQPGLSGYGDADFVISVPPQQYLQRYVFFTDPTYPETSLVLVRRPLGDEFQDVELDCLGTVGGWQALGDYEWTRVDLSTGNFQPVGGCSTGRHELTSAGAVGLWVWGWGTPLTSTFTENVSYGYPGGMNIVPINEVTLNPEG